MENANRPDAGRERDIDLINDLRALPNETPWVEFKQDNTHPEMIGRLASALANSCRLEDRERAYVLWGIDDSTHRVVGSAFDPDGGKVGNQGLAIWLNQALQSSVAFQFRVVDHPDGRVVILEIPPALLAPVMFKGTPFIRIGSATTNLTDHPVHYHALIERLRPYTWEHGMAQGYVTSEEVLDLLDDSKYLQLTGQPRPDSRAGILERLEADRLIGRDAGARWNITNLGAILFARDMRKFDPSLARKAVRFVAYDGRDRTRTVTHRRDWIQGYAAGFEEWVGYLNGLLPQNEHIGQAFREEHPLFPALAIRELLVNALIHQDMTVSGTGPSIELFSDRIEITNPGKPLMQADRMIDLPPRSRNESLAALMRRMRLCEEQGSGLDKVIAQVELFQLPPPLFRVGEDSMQVVLYGPRSFADMTQDERIRACYHHAVLKCLSGDRMKNATLCERFGIDKKNAAMASGVLQKALAAGLIKPADPEHPRAGYVPAWWA
ncbi:MAG: putative DNA binding domain-containing protein [Magnetococcales bacterium]|nr:putative DNA binding domain-containing protein [Magnetococcales bacterium]